MVWRMLPQKNDLRNGFCCSFASVIYLRGFLTILKSMNKNFISLPGEAIKMAVSLLLAFFLIPEKENIPGGLLLFHFSCFIHLFPAISCRRYRMKRLLCFIRAVRYPASADCRILCRSGIRICMAHAAACEQVIIFGLATTMPVATAAS